MTVEQRNTEYWRGEVERADDIDSLRELLEEMSRSVQTWSSFLKNELVSRGFSSYGAFAKRCGVSEKTVLNWIKKDMHPQTRDGFIAAAMALGMDEGQTNYVLMRFGGYPKLYVKNIYDALCLYALRCFREKTDEAARHADYPYGYVEQLKEKVKGAKIKTGVSDARPTPTTKVDSMIGAISRDDELLTFLKQNVSAFLPYHELAVMMDRIADGSTHSLITLEVLPPKFDKILSNLRQQHKVPTRKSLITFGIAHDLTVEMMDTLLEHAGMDKLRANRPEEMILIYAMRCAHFYNAELEYETASRMLESVDDPRIREICAEILEIAVKIDLSYGPKDEPKTVREYVKHVFRRLGMDKQCEEYCPPTSDEEQKK